MTQPGRCGIKGPVHLWKPGGDDVDFEAPPIIKLQLSLPASRPDPPSASAAFCRSLFETVSGRSSHWMWFMRTLSSGHIVHRRQPFLLPPTLKHSHSAEQASDRGSAHTDVAQAVVWMKSSVWFVRAKKCTASKAQEDLWCHSLIPACGKCSEIFLAFFFPFV